jgi:hypothetical protein
MTVKKSNQNDKEFRLNVFCIHYKKLSNKKSICKRELRKALNPSHGKDSKLITCFRMSTVGFSDFDAQMSSIKI